MQFISTLFVVFKIFQNNPNIHQQYRGLFFFKVVCSPTGIDVFMYWSQNKNEKNIATTTDTDR